MVKPRGQHHRSEPAGPRPPAVGHEHDDTQNYHLDDDGDPTTLQAFKDLYKERLPEMQPFGKPGWNLFAGSSRRTAAAKMEVGTLQSRRRPGAGVGFNLEDDSEKSDESKGEGVDHSGRTMYCTECSTLCPETKAGHFQCATCEVVFTSHKGGAVSYTHLTLPTKA